MQPRDTLLRVDGVISQALSAAWRISEEDFMKDNPIWNNLKLRASLWING